VYLDTLNISDLASCAAEEEIDDEASTSRVVRTVKRPGTPVEIVTDNDSTSQSDWEKSTDSESEEDQAHKGRGKQRMGAEQKCQAGAGRGKSKIAWTASETGVVMKYWDADSGGLPKKEALEKMAARLPRRSILVIRAHCANLRRRKTKKP